MGLLMLLSLSLPGVAGETVEGNATSRDIILDVLQLGTVDGGLNVSNEKGKRIEERVVSDSIAKRRC